MIREGGILVGSLQSSLFFGLGGPRVLPWCSLSGSFVYGAQKGTCESGLPLVLTVRQNRFRV